MAQTSVAQFAGELRVPPSQLLEQLRAAGVHKQVAEDVLSEQDKTRLLEYLRKSHGSSEPKNKITLTHKPKVAPGAEKKGAKKAKEIKVWKDEGVKRRTIKTRGDVQGASGWHTPKG